MRGYCGDCEWWRMIGKDGYEGACQRHAPHPHTPIGFGDKQLPQVREEAPETYWQAKANECQVFAAWPITSAEEWCGEFAPKPKESEENQNGKSDTGN